MEPIYVIAVLGESPAVVTELLWWMLTVERRSLAGVEIWATERGAARLLSLVESPVWERLQQETGPLPAVHAPGPPPEVWMGMRIHHLEHAGTPLQDVRTQAECAAVSAILCNRLRALRRDLPARIPLLGSLAGGRKTVSSALQTAFCLQARPGDRLVHVVLDATLESHLRTEGSLSSFSFPTSEIEQSTGIPRQDQLCVHGVPFPRLRGLLPGKLERALDGDWQDIWPLLERHSSDIEASLVQTAVGWDYVLVGRDSQPVATVSLSPRLAAPLAAVDGLEEPNTTTILDWIDANDMGWQPRVNAALDVRLLGIRGALTSLRKRLEADLPTGLDAFIPARGTYALNRLTVCRQPDSELG